MVDAEQEQKLKDFGLADDPNIAWLSTRPVDGPGSAGWAF